VSDWFSAYGFADVHDNLLVGAYPLDVDDVAMLTTLGVRRVLNLVQDEEYAPGQHEDVDAAYAVAGIEEVRLDLVDYGHLPADQLESAVSTVAGWLDEPGISYVHCRAGWQRSAAVAAGAIAVHDGIEIEQALASVQSRKPSADPLPHQRDDLHQWWATRRPAADEA
jgi:predicted protein tyrosine phosphatase